MTASASAGLLLRTGARVLVVSELALRGGAETSTVLLAQALHEQGAKVRLAFARPGEMAQEARRRGVPLLLGAGTRWPGRGRARVPRLLQAASSGHVDLVHVSSLEQRCRWTAAAALRAGVPVVAHLRNPAQVEHALSLHERGAFVVTNSSASAQVLRRAGATRLRFVPNGLTPAAPEPERVRGEVRKELGLLGDASVALAICNITPYKGLDLLLPGVVHALEQRPDLHFVHAGEAVFPTSRAHAEAWRAAIGASGVGDRIHLLGSRSDVTRLHAAADVAVVPSRGEGTARVVLEAWAAGRPVLAADADGIRDLVDSDRNGLLVDLADDVATGMALLRLVDDPSLRLRLAAQGARDLVSRYSQEAHVRALLEVYSGLMNPHDD